MHANHRPADLAPSGADQTAARLAATPGARRAPSPKLAQFILPRWLDAGTCAALIAQIDRDLKPSTIADANGDDAFRTSSTCDLDHANPLVIALNMRLHDLVGIPLPFGEPIQGQVYDVGQEFKAHTDYFDPNGMDWATYCSVAGQRSWTMMIYLNEPDAGGATRFLSTGKLHQPETGKLLAWNNMRTDGHPNPDTLHHGMKVRKGRKYIITKWFREKHWPWAADTL
jgi:prolyl 4-hydroxylase